MLLYTAEDLRFDADSHTSTLPDGRDVPHVTTVLSAVCVSTDFDAVADRSRRAAENVERGRLRGSAVHVDTHAYDDGTLAWDDVHPEVLPFVEAYAEMRERLKLRPFHRERQVFHPNDFYTGIVDAVMERLTDAPLNVLLDLKTGDPDDAAAHLQTAAYELAWRCSNPDIPIHERWSVWLQPRLRVPYRITNYTARPESVFDYDKWRACLTVYNEQPARRRRIS